MPARIIRESIRSSETLAALTADEERLFYRLLTASDDLGRFDARPNVVMANCFQAMLDRVTCEAVDAWLVGLAEHGLVGYYEVDGKRYGYFVSWNKHNRTRGKGKYPAPDCGESVQVAATRGKLRQVAAYSESESESEVNPVPTERTAVPSTLQGWKELVRAAENQQERVKVLIDMTRAHLPNEPRRSDEGGRAVALLKKAADPEYAASLLWQAINAEQRQGDLFTYAMGIARAPTRTNGSKAQPSINGTDWEAEAARWNR